MTTPARPSEILRAARKHISDPAMWVKWNFSAHGISGALKGEPCCAWGAIKWANQNDKEDTDPGTDYLEDALGNDYIEDFNDHPDTTHADVLAAFDRAIAAAEADGQ